MLKKNCVPLYYVECIKEKNKNFQISPGTKQPWFIHHVFCWTKSAAERAFRDRERVYRKGKRKGQYTRPPSVTKNLFGIHGAAPFRPLVFSCSFSCVKPE